MAQDAQDEQDNLSTKFSSIADDLNEEFTDLNNEIVNHQQILNRYRQILETQHQNIHRNADIIEVLRGRVTALEEQQKQSLKKANYQDKRQKENQGRTVLGTTIGGNRGEYTPAHPYFNQEGYNAKSSQA